jgi:hypothetical protein
MRGAGEDRQNPAMASTGAPAGSPSRPRAEVRDATADDLAAIAEVAIATGQDEEWSGSDQSYTGYLLARGRLVVAVRAGRVIGFGATGRIGTGPAAPVMLCDLFVDPREHGGGAGRAMLTALFEGTGPRLTFSSLHGMALPLYTSFGLDAWWPLLYLQGDVRTLPMPDGWSAEPATAAEVAALELAWTGIDRAEDHRAWAARPGGQPLVARRAGRILAAGVAAGAGDAYGLAHLALAPATASAERTGGAVGASDVPGASHGPDASDAPEASDARDAAGGEGVARDAVIAALVSLAAGGATIARAWLPAPHPAVRPLLGSGWRTGEFDLFMATDPSLLDPHRAVPGPALP